MNARMMRKPVAGVMAAFLVSSGCSLAWATNLFLEDFNGTPGDNITTLGWTQANAWVGNCIKIVDPSKVPGSPSGRFYIDTDHWNYADYRKDLSSVYTLAAGETLDVTWVGYAAPDSIASFTVYTSAGKWWQLTCYPYGGGYTQPPIWLVYANSAGLPDAAMDPSWKSQALEMKISATTTNSTLSARLYGDPTWTLMGSSVGMSDISRVSIGGNSWGYGYAYALPEWDHISIDVTRVPAPGALRLIAAGMAGIAGFAVRRKK